MGSPDSCGRLHRGDLCGTRIAYGQVGASSGYMHKGQIIIMGPIPPGRNTRDRKMPRPGSGLQPIEREIYPSIHKILQVPGSIVPMAPGPMPLFQSGPCHSSSTPESGTLPGSSGPPLTEITLAGACVRLAYPYGIIMQFTVTNVVIIRGPGVTVIKEKGTLKTGPGVN